MTTTTRLDPSQQASADRAREILASEHGYDPHALAYRIGQLEHYLGEMLTLVNQLARQ